jgi:Zn ribbon nucleic-acid-binding protein
MRDESEHMSLEDHIVMRRNKLVKERQEATKLREQAKEMRDRSEKMILRWQKRPKHDLIKQAEELEIEASVRESMKREHDFEANVVTYLRAYHVDHKNKECGKLSKQNEIVQVYAKQANKATQRRATILDEYLADMDIAPPKVAMAARDVCPRCDNSSKMILNTVKSIMSCSQCGYAVTYLDSSSSSTSFDEVVDYSQYSYKRVSHYMMWLTVVQGKETHRVHDDILRAVMTDLYERQRVRAQCDITQKRVRESLRRLKLRKAYDHVAQITHRLSGIRPPRLTSEVEDKLKNMFLQMQPAFQRHAPKTRTNFLSYGYVLYRCFQILGLTNMLEGITLLKGREKLEANDAIFRKMASDLGWSVKDLPPASETMQLHPQPLATCALPLKKNTPATSYDP